MHNFIKMPIDSSIGPILLNTITDARKPYTLQRACWIGLVLLGLGWLAISFVDTFPQFLWGSFLRTMVRSWHRSIGIVQHTYSFLRLFLIFSLV